MQEADLKVYSLAACFYDDLSYFGRGLCLLAAATTWLLLLFFYNKHASGKTQSMLSPCYSSLNVSWYMTYLRPTRAGSQAFFSLVYYFALDSGIEFPCAAAAAAAQSQGRVWLVLK